MALLFMQPLSVLFVIVIGATFTLSYLNIVIILLLGLTIVSRKSIHPILIFIALLIIISFLSTYIVSGSDSILVSISIIIQLLIVSFAVMQLPANEKLNWELSKYFNLFVLFMIPSVIIGLLQGISNRPILLEQIITAQNLDINEVNNIWRFGDLTRSFGLFYTNAYYGLYLILLLTLSYSGILFAYSRKRFWYALGFLFLMLALYYTYTRTAYLQTIFILIMLPVVNYLRRKKFSPKRAFSHIVLMTLIFFFSILVYGLGSDRNDQQLSNSQSLNIRMTNWTRIFEAIDDNPMKLLFGYGITGNELQIDKEISPSKVGTVQSVIVDNGYLATLLNGGVFLLILQFALQFLVFDKLYRNFVLSPGMLEAAMITFYSCIALYNFFGNLNNSLLMLGIAPLIFIKRDSRL